MKKYYAALLAFLLAWVLFMTMTVTVPAKEKCKQMYASKKTTAKLSFTADKKNFKYTVIPDDRCDHYIVVGGTGLKEGKVKNRLIYDGSFPKKAIKAGKLTKNMKKDFVKNKYWYFKVMGRDKKTKKYYQAGKIYKVAMTNGKIVEKISYYY